MISYEKACDIAKGVMSDPMFRGLVNTTVRDMKDRWGFVFSISPERGTFFTASPQFFVYKKDGRVEWFNVFHLSDDEEREFRQAKAITYLG